ncbi:NADH oxidoreductase hcr domain protein [Salmonella enterica subsp. enterica serovar Typhi]|nr:NADH oxidoreductase hcr domain protein [Salmonella enterica subsp. enterica serovar Typhi]
MTMPTSQCPWRMQVHHIRQETPDVWTIALLCHDYYPYRAGQYALVSVRNSAETLRAYTLSSTPGVSEYITLTVRRIEDGTGSQWLTHDIKRGGDCRRLRTGLLLPSAGRSCSRIIGKRSIVGPVSVSATGRFTTRFILSPLSPPKKNVIVIFN